MIIHIIFMVLMSLISVLSFFRRVPLLSSQRKSLKFCTFPKVGSDKTDEHFMKLAIRHAQHAVRDIEVPIGAVLEDSLGTVLAASRNQVETKQDASAHAEIVCMREAAHLLGTWRLSGCTVYSTLEPCPMCFAAMQSFRIKRLVYGAKDIRLGACGSYVNLMESKHPFHNIEVTGGLFAETSEGLLKRFFQNRRADNKTGTLDSSYTTRGICQVNG